MSSAPTAPESKQKPRRRRRPRSGPEGRQHRRRVVTYSLFGIALVLLVNALVGDNGYLAGLRARREHEKAIESLSKLQIENSQLREQQRRLRDDPAAVEEAARRDLGLIRPGETLVIIHDKP
jgi:cell division protein FtsB